MTRKSHGAAFLTNAALLAAAAALLLMPDALRTKVLLPVEVIADLLILLLVLARPGRDRILVFSVSMLLFADSIYTLKYLWSGLPVLTFRVMLAAYVLYNLSAVRYLFRAYRASSSGDRSEPALLAALFVVFAALQIKYVAVPAATGAYASLYTGIFVTVHRVVESALLALAVLLGMKARSRYWLLTLNAFTLLPLSSFAIGYNATTAKGVPYAEYGWVLGLFSLLSAQTSPADDGEPFARWDSVRVRLVWFVCSVSALLLLLLYALQAFAARDTFSLTSSLFFLLYGVWLVANFIAFRVSEDIRSLLKSVEGPGAAENSGFSLALHEAELFAEKLKTAYATIKEQSRMAALAGLSAQVAHDIRSPLAALDSALKDVPQLPGGKIDLIRGAACRIRDIADDLLDKNRAAGGRTAAPSPCRLAGLIEAAAAEKRMQLDGSGVSVAVGLGAAAGGILAAAVPAEFSRVLSNLINNAVEALDGKGTVTLGLRVDGGFAVATVTDDGKGIPPEALPELGRRGYTAGKAGGCGLGLYHARTSAEAWGGGLDITSAPGKGTTVSIRLPLVSSGAGHPAAGGRAVLLDDDALVRMNWSVSAKAAGVDLKVFREPAELLDAAAALPKDIPLYIDSDLGGGLAGEDVAAELRGRGFLDITMATGHGAERFSAFGWLKVAGKEPPWENAG